MFAGHAGLSNSLWQHGFEAYAIDWQGNRHLPQIPILKMDLCTQQGQDQFWELLKNSRVRYVHLAPPCGTFSRAREIKIPAHILATGVKAPKQLRSQQCPRGLENIDECDQEKVKRGNILADFTAEVLRRCHQMKIHCSVENPAGSYLWDLQAFKQLAATKGISSTDFQSCMYGGKRDKRTRILHTGLMASICKLCDGNHEHEPWGVHMHRGRAQFATALECEYPKGLCQTMAQCAQQVCGTTPPPHQAKARSRPSPAAAQQRAAVGKPW